MAGDEIIPESVREPIVEAAPEPRRSERLHKVHDVLLLESDEPATYAEAMMSPDSEAWLEAIRSELIRRLARPLVANGSLRRKPMWMEMFRSTKLGLSLRVMDKFKELTTTRLTRR